MQASWGIEKTNSRAVSNQFVIYRDGKAVGSIDKPKDTKTDKNAWRVNLGVGFACKFLGHEWTKNAAIAKLVTAVKAQNS